MTDVRINGVRQQAAAKDAPPGISPDRLRTIVQDSRLNFLTGGGQDERGTASKVPVVGPDPDEVSKVGEAVSQAVNG